MGIEVWAIRCPCGLELVAPDTTTLVGHVNAHLAQQHPRLVGAYQDEDVLSLAYRKPTIKAVR